MSTFERIPGKPGDVGGLPINRAMPTARRRLIGAWCFLDHAGPADLKPGHGMRVGPHPHTGLQTFSWMIEGEVLHRDSLGSEQVLRQGQVNLMTAGRAIAHSEESLSDRLHLAQLWIALPDSQRFCEPAFEHFPVLPHIASGGFDITLLTGRFGGAQSPVPQYTPLLGLDIACKGKAAATVPLDTGFEHGLMVLEGALTLSLDGAEERIEPGSLIYLPPGAASLELRSETAARLLLLGGEPMQEQPLLFWNFIGRNSEEIQRFARDWNDGTGTFAGVEVHGFDGPRLAAPDASHLHLKAAT
ncbi:pirin family protein [Paucibacter sp. R3-3]|uniref:Pirin family protein n=1 Tax=Roseateles agri TaxID=3098619 RepID=A0ABU5DCR8_9BURK|nr:pirin family protein [Paucibacter sp. R3-3]MDY0744077.1 pirin family protein [Paucibacter sp. R3-3]